MFTIDHLLWIFISIAVIITLVFLSKRFKFSYKTATYVILGIYIASEVVKYCTHMFPVSRWLGEGAKVDGFTNAQYLLQKSLPLHLCTMTLFFVIYLAFGKNERRLETVKSFVTTVSLIAAPLAILLGTCLSKDNTANLFDSFKDPTLSPVQFFIYHAGMVWYGIYLVSTKQVKFGFKVWKKNFFIMLILIIGSVWVNSILAVYGTNFMFTVAPPAKGLPLLNLDHGWPLYMFFYILLVGVLTFLFQLPAIIKEIKAKKKEN